jgi:hypothetical protein
MSAVQPSATAANNFAVNETSFSLSSVNINASDGERRHISCQSVSSKPRARHSLLRELSLATLSKLTLKKKKGNCMNMFGIRRVHFADSKRNTWERC